MRAWFILLLLLSTPIVWAAQLSGTVYTDDLQPAKYSLLIINTTPVQRVLLADGTYTINVPKGTYELTVSYSAQGKRYEDSLNVTVIDESAYSYDFVLFPVESNATVLIPVDTITVDDPPQIGWVPALVLVILLAALVLLLSRKRWWEKTPVQEMPADLESILIALKKEGGRATQKELRRHIPCSEAKMSLMLTELEAKGKIERIKKGRGNLIVLK
jgi:uncharacterized membrane protein